MTPSQRQKRFARIGSRNQAGVGLIEVMIAVLVLSIGFLAVAALQARSLSTNNSAMVRSMATIASYSILDAMRADRTNAANYNGTYKGNACPTTNSTLAQTQIAAWCSQELKPLGQSATTIGTINCAAAAGTQTSLCKVIIQFDDSRAGDAGSSASSQTFVTQALL
ncbi:type IV pilus modification protein PilV [Dyella flagellata]|uniref:Type IV pilus modification protein PilV n=1 Tax=Dyella flagellata TaxID=1867833 RepID=A0ABQ5X8I4_9GAMM|nr:type IV pilus modification protein PilV [Dyella flagellata]GLQ87971.1 hypothetical protein GCM10007898_15390 [Dyella flagellata]